VRRTLDGELSVDVGCETPVEPPSAPTLLELPPLPDVQLRLPRERELIERVLEEP